MSPVLLRVYVVRLPSRTKSRHLNMRPAMHRPSKPRNRLKTGSRFAGMLVLSYHSPRPPRPCPRILLKTCLWCLRTKMLSKRLPLLTSTFLIHPHLLRSRPMHWQDYSVEEIWRDEHQEDSRPTKYRSIWVRLPMAFRSYLRPRIRQSQTEGKRCANP
jgi:hypothetical protein